MPAALASPAWAFKFELVPTLSARTEYSDNISLAPNELKQGDLVTMVTPGATLNATEGRLRFVSSFAAQVVNRADSGQTKVTPQFNFNTLGSVELVPQLLYVDSRSNIQQQNVSLLLPQTDSVVNSTGNRATVRTFVVSPYLRQNFGSNAQGEARLNFSTFSTDAAGQPSDSHTTGVSMQLRSGPAFKLTNWGIAYEHSQLAYGGDSALADQTKDKISVNAGRLITSTLRLIGNLGFEDNGFVATSGSSQGASRGASWSGGLDWTPTPRTRFSGTLGRRYFGRSYGLDFSHRTRLTSWTAGYSEDLTTTQEQSIAQNTASTASSLDGLFAASIPDPIARQTAVQNFISQNGIPAGLNSPLNFLSTRNFLLKRWQGSFAINGVRNTVVLNGFRQSREALDGGAALGVAGDFGASNTVNQTGGSVLWNWRFATHAASNVSIGYTRSEFPGATRTDGTSYLNVAVTRQFLPKLSGSVNFRSRHNDSSTAGTSYSENAVSAGLNMSF